MEYQDSYTKSIAEQISESDVYDEEDSVTNSSDEESQDRTSAHSSYESSEEEEEIKSLEYEIPDFGSYSSYCSSDTEVDDEPQQESSITTEEVKQKELDVNKLRKKLENICEDNSFEPNTPLHQFKNPLENKSEIDPNGVMTPLPQSGQITPQFIVKGRTSFGGQNDLMSQQFKLEGMHIQQEAINSVENQTKDEGSQETEKKAVLKVLTTN